MTHKNKRKQKASTTSKDSENIAAIASAVATLLDGQLHIVAALDPDQAAQAEDWEQLRQGLSRLEEEKTSDAQRKENLHGLANEVAVERLQLDADVEELHEGQRVHHIRMQELGQYEENLRERKEYVESREDNRNVKKLRERLQERGEALDGARQTCKVQGKEIKNLGERLDASEKKNAFLEGKGDAPAHLENLHLKSLLKDCVGYLDNDDGDCFDDSGNPIGVWYQSEMDEEVLGEIRRAVEPEVAPETPDNGAEEVPTQAQPQ